MSSAHWRTKTAIGGILALYVLVVFQAVAATGLPFTSSFETGNF